MSDNSNHWDYSANQYNNNADHISSNGGMGSIEYWNNINNAKNAQTMADLEREAAKTSLYTPVDYTNPFTTQTNHKQIYYSNSINSRKPTKSIFNAKTLTFLLFFGLSFWIYDTTYNANRVFSSEIEPIHFLMDGFSSKNPSENKKYQQWNLEMVKDKAMCKTWLENVF